MVYTYGAFNLYLKEKCTNCFSFLVVGSPGQHGEGNEKDNGGSLWHGGQGQVGVKVVGQVSDVEV